MKVKIIESPYFEREKGQRGKGKVDTEKFAELINDFVRDKKVNDIKFNTMGNRVIIIYGD